MNPARPQGRLHEALDSDLCLEGLSSEDCLAKPSCGEIDGLSFKTQLSKDMMCLLYLKKDAPVNLKHDFKNIT